MSSALHRFFTLSRFSTFSIFAIFSVFSLATGCFYLYFGSNSPVIASNPAPIQAIQLHQKHYFFGEMELTLSNAAVKVKCLGQMRFIVVAKAPLWTVTIFRTDDKTRYDESLASFVDTTLISGMMVSYRDKYTMQGCIPKPIHVEGFKAVKLLNRNDEFVYIPSEKAIPTAVYDIIHASYKMPTCGGIPLRYVIAAKGKDLITQMDETGQHHKFLETSKISHVSLSPDFFDTPTGFKKARSIQDVVLSSSKRNESSELGLMFWKEDDSKKQLDGSKKTPSSLRH